MEKLTKSEEFHRDLMHDIIETNKTYTVVQGIGDESLTENDKRILRGEEMRSPLLDHFNISDSE